MKLYLDSSAVIKLYVAESKSAQVAGYVRLSQHPIPFSHLHDLEIRNGLRLKLFRAEASAKEVRAWLELINADLADGVLQRPDLNWFDVFRRAETLSGVHTGTLGCRSLDVLQVASALALEARDFLTFDDRQGALAAKAGLNVIAL